ncbi:MAG: endonuclease/exonuclease/phosphatase family protein [Planctomycetales bacterium]
MTQGATSWRRRLPQLAGIGILAVIIPALAGFAPQFGWVFELASHFRAQYLWGLLGASLVCLLLRQRWLALVGGGLALVHLGLVLPYYGTRPVPAEPGEPLRIVSLNVFGRNRDHARVCDFVRQSDPDVAVFLEVNSSWGEALQELTDEWPHSLTESQFGNFGVAIYSKRPLEAARIEFLGQGIPAIVATVRAGQMPVTIFGAHPHSPISPQDASDRDASLSLLGKLASDRTSHRLIVGDLNCTSWTPVFARLLEVAGLRDSRLGWGLQTSWPAYFPPLLRIPIDHCLVSPGIDVLRHEIGPAVGSDHLPVIVDLRISQPVEQP